MVVNNFSCCTDVIIRALPQCARRDPCERFVHVKYSHWSFVPLAYLQNLEGEGAHFRINVARLGNYVSPL